MQVEKLEIPDILILKPKVYRDDRGFFFESYHTETFAGLGITENFVQDNHVKSGSSVLRGMHYQIPPKAQAKLVRVIRGSVLDVAVDIRKGSPTFGHWVAVTLSEKNQNMIYVPAGFAHGYVTLEPDTEVLYKVSNDYSPKHERGFRWDDETLNIDWSAAGPQPVVSERDRGLPKFKEIEVTF